MNATPVDSNGRRSAIDGAHRRRVYLFRHGAVSYFDSAGNVVPDTDLVDLNEKGVAQAEAMRGMFHGVPIDRAICSGLPRTRQTGEIILGNRQLTIEDDREFREIRQVDDFDGDFDLITDVAFSHSRATEPDARFLGGERYASFYDRIANRLDGLFAEPEWNDAAVFAHGGTNAAVIGWATGMGLSAFGAIDQATACLNVIDVDLHESGTILRKSVRALNVSADNPTHSDRHCSDMESLAWLIKSQSTG